MVVFGQRVTREGMHILAGEGDQGPALGPRVEGRQTLLKMGPRLPYHQSISQGLPALELQIKAQKGGFR